MRAKLAGATAGLALLGLAGAGIASAANGSDGSAPAAEASAPSREASTPSRLDDGKQYGSRAKITEQEAIDAAQTGASGDLDEIDLEYVDGRLVFNVDVGSHDVKVDAGSGDVVSVDQDD